MLGKLTAVGLLLLALGSFSVGAPAFAASDTEIQEQIQEVIIQRHPTDTAEWWRGLGPTTPRNIISMYQKSTHIHHRVRLLQGLGWFDTPEAAEFLKEQATSTREDAIRITAIRSVGHSQGARAQEFLAKFLEHPDVQTRFAAADALKRLRDPGADEIVARYLKTEKAPWIADKLQGKLPVPKGTLGPVTSSEDRLSPDFNGEWRGYWISPKGPAESGMNSESAVFRLKVEGASALRGDLAVMVPKEKTPRTYRLERVTGKGVKVSGVLVEVLPVSATPAPSPRIPAELPFEAELSQQAGSFLVELRVKKVGATLIVRRNPSAR